MSHMGQDFCCGLVSMSTSSRRIIPVYTWWLPTVYTMARITSATSTAQMSFHEALLLSHVDNLGWGSCRGLVENP